MRGHCPATGAGLTMPWRPSPGRTATRTRRRGTALRPPPCRERTPPPTSAPRRGQAGSPGQAAWHRAAATVVPDEDVAADLERSAARAEQHGGYVAQATFLARAAELTPDARDRAVRLFAAAQAHLVAGDGALAEALLDRAAPLLAAAGMHVAAQRLRASIAVFFSRHRAAPAILLDAVAAADPHDVPLIRGMLFEALQAALVARQYTTGMSPADVAHAALRAPRDPARAVTAVDLLLDGFATRIAVGYSPAMPLLRAAVDALCTDEQPMPAGLPACHHPRPVRGG